jgi:hypothetical protein
MQSSKRGRVSLSSKKGGRGLQSWSSGIEREKAHQSPVTVTPTSCLFRHTSFLAPSTLSTQGLIQQKKKRNPIFIQYFTAVSTLYSNIFQKSPCAAFPPFRAGCPSRRTSQGEGNGKTKTRSKGKGRKEGRRASGVSRRVRHRLYLKPYESEPG